MRPKWTPFLVIWGISRIWLRMSLNETWVWFSIFMSTAYPGFRGVSPKKITSSSNVLWRSGCDRVFTDSSWRWFRNPQIGKRTELINLTDFLGPGPFQTRSRHLESGCPVEKTRRQTQKGTNTHRLFRLPLRIFKNPPGPLDISASRSIQPGRTLSAHRPDQRHCPSDRRRTPLGRRFDESVDPVESGQRGKNPIDQLG